MPGCGHLWFIQTLTMCYISLAVCSRIKFIGKLFRSNRISLLVLIVIFLCGFIYRGADLVYLFFYIWVYYNSKKINQQSTKAIFCFLVIILLFGYYLLFLHYEEAFIIGIYLRTIQICIMALLMIKLFLVVFENTKNNCLISGISVISMEFYLIHHLFVFDYPIYISLIITLALSVILHFVSKRFDFFIFNKYNKAI